MTRAPDRSLRLGTKTSSTLDGDNCAPRLLGLLFGRRTFVSVQVRVPSRCGLLCHSTRDEGDGGREDADGRWIMRLRRPPIRYPDTLRRGKKYVGYKETLKYI